VNLLAAVDLLLCSMTRCGTKPLLHILAVANRDDKPQYPGPT
jgi:hypothetical protein